MSFQFSSSSGALLAWTALRKQPVAEVCGWALAPSWLFLQLFPLLGLFPVEKSWDAAAELS